MNSNSRTQPLRAKTTSILPRAFLLLICGLWITYPSHSRADDQEKIHTFVEKSELRHKERKRVRDRIKRELEEHFGEDSEKVFAIFGATAEGKLQVRISYASKEVVNFIADENFLVGRLNSKRVREAMPAIFAIKGAAFPVSAKNKSRTNPVSESKPANEGPLFRDLIVRTDPQVVQDWMKKLVDEANAHYESQKKRANKTKGGISPGHHLDLLALSEQLRKSLSNERTNLLQIQKAFSRMSPEQIEEFIGRQSPEVNRTILEIWSIEQAEKKAPLSPELTERHQVLLEDLRERWTRLVIAAHAEKKYSTEEIAKARKKLGLIKRAQYLAQPLTFASMFATFGCMALGSESGALANFAIFVSSFIGSLVLNTSRDRAWDKLDKLENIEPPNKGLRERILNRMKFQDPAHAHAAEELLAHSCKLKNVLAAATSTAPSIAGLRIAPGHGHEAPSPLRFIEDPVLRNHLEHAMAEELANEEVERLCPGSRAH